MGCKGFVWSTSVGGVGKVALSKAATGENWMHMSGMRHSAILCGCLRMHLVCVTLLGRGSLPRWWVVCLLGQGPAEGVGKRGKWRSGSVA
jgi:hypothetical protein